MPKKEFHVLLVEDNKHDVRFVRRAWQQNRITNILHVVPHGQACIDYLLNQGEYSDSVKHPKPGLVLLDIRMPVMDGIECLRRIRELPELKRLPVVMLTTSKEEEDLIRGYELGCNSFIQKPVDFDRLSEAVRVIHLYWTLSELPPL
ncbi:MAG: response regulator [Ardenticatenaceae bacterium]|nr:response regulator [Anaerolineales bacterium]MCB8941967.1 response regulator [Ardenticatenaceae bacterium]MCB8973080.1 response regulator [Ardenticatenaceae bacterium]